MSEFPSICVHPCSRLPASSALPSPQPPQPSRPSPHPPPRAWPSIPPLPPASCQLTPEMAAIPDLKCACQMTWSTDDAALHSPALVCNEAVCPLCGSCLRQDRHCGQNSNASCVSTDALACGALVGTGACTSCRRVDLDQGGDDNSSGDGFSSMGGTLVAATTSALQSVRSSATRASQQPSRSAIIPQAVASSPSTSPSIALSAAPTSTSAAPPTGAPPPLLVVLGLVAGGTALALASLVVSVAAVCVRKRRSTRVVGAMAPVQNLSRSRPTRHLDRIADLSAAQNANYCTVEGSSPRTPYPQRPMQGHLKQIK